MSPVQTEQEQADKADKHMNSKKKKGCCGMLQNPHVQLQKTGAAACCGMLQLHMLGSNHAQTARFNIPYRPATTANNEFIVLPCRGAALMGDLLHREGERERERECVCVSVCEGDGEGDRGRERKRLCVCVCVCVCVRETETEREGEREGEGETVCVCDAQIFQIKLKLRGSTTKTYHYATEP